MEEKKQQEILLEDLESKFSQTKEIGKGLILGTTGPLTVEMMQEFLRRIFNPNKEERLEDEKRKEQEWVLDAIDNQARKLYKTSKLSEKKD